MRIQLPVISLITLLFPVMLCSAGEYSTFSEADGPRQGKVSRVVIDAGHGGTDPGTCFGKTQEKDITLAIALKLGTLIEQNMPDVDVIYTREKDVAVGLYDRAETANRADADLFVSIHINASGKNPAANGTGTYIMGHDKSGANLEVVTQENEVIKYEADYKTTYGLAGDDPASSMIFNLKQFSNQSQSMMLAEIIQKHYVKELPLADRSTFHAGFLVLWRTSMPSVLTEIGFMTHKGDRDYISSNKGQNEAALSLFNALSEYKSRVEERSSMIQLEFEEEPADNKRPVADRRLPDISSTPVAGGGNRSAAGQAAADTPSDRRTAGVSASGTGSARPDPSRDSVAPDRNAAEQQSAQSTILYYVQVMASKNPVSVNSSAFKSYRGMVQERYISGGAYPYKYVVGGVSSYEQASSTLAQLKREFPGAFLVAFDGGKPISVDEARKR